MQITLAGTISNGATSCRRTTNADTVISAKTAAKPVRSLKQKLSVIDNIEFIKQRYLKVGRKDGSTKGGEKMYTFKAK